MRSTTSTLTAGPATPSRRAPSQPRTLILLALVLAALVLAAAASGAVQIPLARLPSLLFAVPQGDEEAMWRNVLLQVRLPRVLLAVVVGAGLALSGAAIQALFRNPLAEPGLIGVSQPPSPTGWAAASPVSPACCWPASPSTRSVRV